MSYNRTNIPVRSDPPYSDYELIDVDPHFKRVISYFRLSDYGVWAASAAGFPLALAAWERLEPRQGAFSAPQRLPGGAIRLATSLGCFGGFLYAYVRSSKRFLGWSENAREVKKDRYETKKLLSQGVLPFKEDKSVLDDRLQDIANRNSQFSFTTMAILPWFNWAHHPYHGVDLKKYYETRQGEENWGFKLQPLDEIKAKYAKHVD